MGDATRAELLAEALSDAIDAWDYQHLFQAGRKGWAGADAICATTFRACRLALAADQKSVARSAPADLEQGSPNARGGIR